MNSSALSLLYGPTLTSIHDYWKNIALTIQIFVSNVMSLLFNMLSRFVISFLSRSKCLWISCLQLLSAVIQDPNQRKSVTASTSISHEVMGPDQFSSVAQSCPTPCDPMDCSTLGLPVHHQLPEFTQAHVHQVNDAIQPSHPLSSHSPPAFNLSQHQGLFQWVSSSH